MKGKRIMKTKLIIVVTLFVVLIFSLYSRPSYNGTSVGCAGGSCHSLTQNIVTASDLGGMQVEITVTGVQTGAHVAGELVNGSGSVVVYLNSTSNNPFTLTAPSAGTYIVNAGYRYPSLNWGTTSVNVTGTSSTGDGNKKVENKFQLYGNYPNPFNMETLIKFDIDKNTFTKLNIYNTKGQKVKTLVDRQYVAGTYTIKWNGKDDSENDLSSGTYILELVNGKNRMSRKIMLLK